MAKRDRDKSKPHSLPAPVLPLKRLSWLAIGMGVGLWALTFIAYRPAASAGFIWDDDDYIEKRFTLWSPTGLRDIWFSPAYSPQYYPLVFTTFRIEWQLWQFNPRGYHEVNIFLHAMSAIVLWRILRRLNVPGAYFAAAIFAVHPVMVESVAWVTERKNTLSLLFYLLALRSYLKFALATTAETAFTAAHWKKHWLNYALGLVFFAAALFSKTVTSSLPAAVLLILWWKRGRLTLIDLLFVAPFFAIGVPYGLFTAQMERDHVGAFGADWNFSFPQRVLIASKALWFYLYKLLLPVKLSFVYAKWDINPRNAINWVFPALLAGVFAALFLLRRRIGLGPLVAALLFAGTLFPALGFINVFPMRYTFAADHYQYHASIAMIVLFAAGCAIVLRRFGAKHFQPAIGAAVVLVLVLGGLTFARSRVYKDRYTLWTDTLTKNQHWMVWGNLGNEAVERKPPDLEAAKYYYSRAIEAYPEAPDNHYCLGLAFSHQEQHEAAERSFRRAVAIAPKYPDALNMLGFTLRKLGKDDEAERCYRESIANNPVHYRAMFNLGVLLKDKGKLSEAAAMLERARRINPRHVPTSEHLGDTYRRMNRPQDAIAAYEHILSFQPDNAEALFNAALLLRITGDLNRGAQYLSKALQLKPELRNRLSR